MRKLYPILLLAVGIYACSKGPSYVPLPPSQPTPPAGSPTDSPAAPLRITSINPTHGPKNSYDTIFGSGFSSTLNSNQVSFNGKTATVVSASANKLIVMVPEKAGDGKVAITVNSVTATGPDFRYDAFAVSVLAGNGSMASVDGIGRNASLSYPVSIAADTLGNLFVAEVGTSIISKITPDGAVSRYAGVVGDRGTVDGPRLSASFNMIYAVCTDNLGNVYVGDVGAVNIRKIGSDGIVSEYVRIGTSPSGLAMDNSGVLYVAGSTTINKVSTAGQRDVIFPTANTLGPLGTLWAITFASNGNMLVTDRTGNTVNRILPDGRFVIVAGSPAFNQGFKDGKADTALFLQPYGLATDKAGNIYIADMGNNAIRKISTDGIVTTLIHNVSQYAGTQSRTFSGPGGLCIDKNNILYIANTRDCTILKVVFDQ